MARWVVSAVVGTVVASLVVAAGLVFSADLGAGRRAALLLPLIVADVAIVTWFIRRGNAEVEARRPPVVAMRNYAVTGRSPYEGSVRFSGAGRCEIHCHLCGRASGTYELLVRDGADRDLPTLPLHAGSSPQAWENAPAPGVAYDDAGPAITLSAPDGPWEITLVVKILVQDGEAVDDLLTIEARQRPSSDPCTRCHATLPDAITVRA